MSRVRWWVGLVAAGCALSVVACDGDAPVETGEAATPAPSPPPITPPTATPDAGGTRAAEPDDTVEEDPPAQPEGLSEHRPTQDVAAIADCEKIVTDEPGAVIAFPSEEGPGWLEAGAAPVLVEFVGCSNTDDATIIYEATHDGEAATVQGVAMGGAMGQWEEFRFEEIFEASGVWTVAVFELDADSGERQTFDEVTLTVDDGGGEPDETPLLPRVATFFAVRASESHTR